MAINPFQAPINYAVDVQSPFEAALGGFKLGAGVAEVEANRAARERAVTAQTALGDLFKNPNATATDYARVTAFLPKDQAAIVQEGFKAQTQEQQQNTLRVGTQAYTAIKSGNLDVAQMQLKEQAEALRNAGKEKEAQGYDDLSNLIRMNPTGAQATIGLSIAQLPGGTDFLTNADKALSTIRTEALAPSVLSKSVADAAAAVADKDKKIAEAKDTPARLAAEQEKRVADAALAKVNAEYADQVAQDAIKQRAATLGLTNNQANQVLAATRKLGVETKKAALELAAIEAGVGDPKEKFTQEEKIRKEWQVRSKMYSELQGTFNTLKASADSSNGPGDIALITGFMKMLDPGSVVRETEFATARDTAGLFTQLQNRLEKAKNGQLLDPKQRNEYVALSQKYLDSAQKKAAQEKKDLGIVVKNYKLNPENVFGAEQASPTPLPASATVGGVTYSRPAGFTDAQWNDYLKASGVIK
jgi:hypothetical protein